MTDVKPFNMLVIDAVGASNLPADLRHLLMTLAYLANGKTGQGWSGQDTIGAFMGCSAREVRRKLDRLDACPNAPVRVIRQYRSRSDGRGRGSDMYQLRLINRTPTSGETQRSLGRESPVEAPRAGETNRTSMPDQPDVGVPTNRTSASRDPRSRSTEQIHGATLSRPKVTTGPQPARARKVRTAKTETHTTEQKRAHAELTEFYFTEFERLRASKPIGWGAKEGKAVHDLLRKLKYDVPAAKRIVSNGLGSWDKATIMSIASNPSACVTGTAATKPGQGVRSGDRADELVARAQRLEAAEARGAKALR